MKALFAIVAAIDLLILAPCVYLALSANSDDLIDPNIGLLLIRTGALVFCVTSLSVIIALPIAWLIERTDLPFGKFWSVVTPLPLVIPSYVATFALVVIRRITGMPELYGFSGAVIILTLLSYPYVLLPARAAFAQMDASIVEAARSLGCGRARVFLRVTLPLLSPAIGAGALLAALYTLSDFGAVSLLGCETLTWAVYQRYSSAVGRDAAASLALLLLLVGFALIALESVMRNRLHRRAQSAPRPPARVTLGVWKYPASVFLTSIVFFALGLPAAGILYWLGRSAVFLPDAAALGNSTALSLAAATAVVVAAFPVALLSAKKMSGTWFLERVASVGFAIPGIALALALVSLSVEHFLFLYQTLPLLVLAYVILYLQPAIGPIRASLLRSSRSVEESARILGGPVRAFFRVTLPIVRPGFVAGFLLVFFLVMKELPVVLILAPIGFKTLAVSVWSGMSEAYFARASVPAAWIILVSSVPLAVLSFRR